ncbi:hypothetical protein [Mycobacterium sp. RTGN5]|uniref:hypothetical protein n=1 Tax=Mycobacterium sp. RTGN5 TaxID=3016522 RepID=UPI0029C9B193|nr:hypothetical protein [Mycobacterium sp. RTGN5]
METKTARRVSGVIGPETVSAADGVVLPAEGVTFTGAAVRALWLDWTFDDDESADADGVAASLGATVAALGAAFDEAVIVAWAAAPDRADRAPEPPLRGALDADEVEALLFEEPALLEPASAPATPSPWGPASAKPVTNAAAPIRAVSPTATRLFLDDPDFGMLPLA